MPRGRFDGVAIAGAAQSRYEKRTTKTIYHVLHEALEAALASADIPQKRLDGHCVILAREELISPRGAPPVRILGGGEQHNQLEAMGFCPRGGAADFVRRHDTTVKGDFPINTGGGQMSAGQAGASGGMIGVVEAILQLQGRAVFVEHAPEQKLPFFAL